MLDLKILTLRILFFLCLLIPGVLLGKAKRLEQGAVKSITALLTDVAMPALVLVKLLETEPGSITPTEVLCCTLFPVLVPVLFFCAVRLLGRGKDQNGRVACFCSIFSNCGFLGIPLASAVFPDSPKIAVLVSLFNVFSTFMLLTLGSYMLSGDKRHVHPAGALCKPITLAVAAGLLLSLFAPRALLSPLQDYAGYLAALTTPLAMLALGLQLSALPLRALFTTRLLYPVSAVKLLLVPLLATLALALLRAVGLPVSDELAVSLFLSFAVSTAASAPAMAAHLGGDGRLATVLTLGTTLFCMLSLPLVSLIYIFIF